MPAMAAIALVVALVFLVFSLMLPVVLKFFTVPILIAALVVAAVAFMNGDDLQWLGVKLSARFIEDGRVTSEIVEEEK